MKTNPILSTTKYVVDNSQYVKINIDKLTMFSNNFEPRTGKHWIKGSPCDFSEFNNEKMMNFLLILDGVNFCYWGEPKWTVQYKNELFDGSFGMIMALIKALEDGYPLLNYQYISSITEKDFAEILKGNIEIPLFYERLNNIREIGKIVSENFQGNFANVLQKVNSDLDLLNIIIENFPSFTDKSIYNDEEIYFYKRAQLLTADIFQVIPEDKYGIENLNNLTGFADYKILQNLRENGLLEYDSFLADKVDSKIEIEKGSKEEIEIRANTIWAIERIKEIVKTRYNKINSVIINDNLWLMSQKGSNKPYHRTRTTAY